MARDWNYTDIYVAACLRPFSSHAEGRMHERDCPECQGIINPPPAPSRKREDGGPAFPLALDPVSDAHEAVISGMSLRDYFAAAALQGMLTHGDHESKCISIDIMNRPNEKRCMTEAEFAGCAYSLADAMLAARED